MMKMKKRVPISQIMSKNPVSLAPDQSLSQAEKIFDDLNIRHIPIVSEGRIIGIISRSDLLRVSTTEFDEEENEIEAVVFDRFTIPQVMTKNPITVNADRTIRETARILSFHSFNALPVVKDGELVGIVTATDLITYLLDQY